MRGDHNLAARTSLSLTGSRGEDRGDEIREALAGPRARFHDEMLAIRNGVFDGGRHLQLLGSRFVVAEPPRDMATVAENLKAVEGHRVASLD